MRDGTEKNEDRMEIPLFARVSAHGTISFVAQLRTLSFCLPFRRRAIGCTMLKTMRNNTLKYIFISQQIFSSPSNHHKFPFESE